ncbi:hypothetical protein GBAR_LOCUS27352 [Geodia barretti]|uniref:Uncharacterized protein n=1 Tax=Geodia barretti TaxID=519541 RepID=A0AA35TL47_GEOBA|nr:hypothetical protein GBAR_LOCUS27352 [Geodia barretti]
MQVIRIFGFNACDVIARIPAVHYLCGTQPLLLHLLHFLGVDIILYV